MRCQKDPDAWLIVLIGLLLVGLIGYLDLLTADYSVLIYYAVPVSLVAWFLRLPGTVLMSLVSGAVRGFSEYYSHDVTKLTVWNTVQDTVFLFIFGLLIIVVRKSMDLKPRLKSRD